VTGRTRRRGLIAPGRVERNIFYIGLVIQPRIVRIWERVRVLLAVGISGPEALPVATACTRRVCVAVAWERDTVARADPVAARRVHIYRTNPDLAQIVRDLLRREP